MKTRAFLLLICAMLLAGTGHAISESHLTEDPSILNGGFEYPVTATSDPDVADWVEAGGFNTFSNCLTRKYGTGDWKNGAGLGAQCAQLVAPNDCIYQPVSTFLPNTVYVITCWIGKRNQAGPSGRVELWAGGDPALITGDDAVNYYGSAGFQLAASGATLVDSASFDYSYLGQWDWLTGTKTFTLVTGNSHTKGDPLYLLFLRGGVGGQLGVDDVTIIISPDTMLMDPKDGETGLPVTTDSDPETADTTLVWIGPSTFEGETFDVYFGTEPNTLNPGYNMVQIGNDLPESTPFIDPKTTGDLDYNTTYHWIVKTYEPNSAPGGVPTLYSTETASFNTTADEPPVVTFAQLGVRTWNGAPSAAVSATVTDSEAIDSLTWQITTSPENHLGDPSLFVTNVVIAPDKKAFTADFLVNTTDPNAFGFYVLTLTATDAVDVGPATVGSDTVYFVVHENACLAFQGNGGRLSSYDYDDNCMIDLTDAAAWFTAWLENINPSNPIYYGYTP